MDIEEMVWMIFCREITQAIREDDYSQVRSLLDSETAMEHLPWLMNVRVAFETGNDGPIESLDTQYQPIATQIVAFVREHEEKKSKCKSANELYFLLMAALHDHDMTRFLGIMDTDDVKQNLPWVRRVLSFLVMGEEEDDVPFDCLSAQCQEFAQAFVAARAVTTKREKAKKERERRVLIDLVANLKASAKTIRAKSGSFPCSHCTGTIEWSINSLGLVAECSREGCTTVKIGVMGF